MAYRFRGRFSGTIFRMDARQRLYRKERRLQSERRRPRKALPAEPQQSIVQDGVKLLGDVIRNPQFQQAALQILPRLLGLPKPPSLPMLPPPR